ncbi:MAG: ATP-binding protein, partial [Candidatus Margulisbacteria bacterium]|nr:ATP-binding protein [Candidatus Margulisiibacteriota bacterium]
PKVDIKIMTFEDYSELYQENLDKVKKENIQLVIVVGDNAGGLPEDIVSTFFEPYVSKGKEGGTGLGSWMIKNGAEDILNGQLLLDNQPGEGLFYHIFI